METDPDFRTAASARILWLLSDVSGDEEALARCRAEAALFDPESARAELQAVLDELERPGPREGP